jgi:hypothetical protein
MRKAGISIISVLLLAGVIFLGSCGRSRTPKYNWDTEYNLKSDRPYGLRTFHDLMKEQGHEMEAYPAEDYYLIDTTQTNASLIMIDSYIEMDSFTVRHLLDFVKNGNSMFVALEETPYELLSHFVPSIDSSGYKKFHMQAINVGFMEDGLPFNDKLRFHYQFLKRVDVYGWGGYTHDNFKNRIAGENVKPISFFNDTIINCFYVPYGKGKVVFHTNPILFTNYNLIKKDGYKNASNVLSHLNGGKIIWYQYSYFDQNDDHNRGTNPLKFLFSHYTLKAGWYVLIASILIFLLFRSKREQRIIPVIYKHKNASIEYAKAVGSLYYKRRSHSGIANELYAVFLSDIRTRYQIVTSGEQKLLIERISQKSEVSTDILEDLFKHFDARHDVNATPRQLIKLHKALENFNKIKK